MLTSLYTLTPLHCGTGQTTGAVDLPIAREHHTRLPILPATSLKGALRNYGEEKKWSAEAIKTFFGPEIKAATAGKVAQVAEPLAAGGVIFGEGKLLAFPVRSLNRPFMFVTSPLLLERLHQCLGAHGISGRLPSSWTSLVSTSKSGDAVYVSSSELAEKPLVLEDLFFDKSSVKTSAAAAEVAKAFAGLLPDNQTHAKSRLETSLVVVQDDLLIDLVERTTPVQARIHLGPNKTTSEGGNLWYEETLPADTLLYAVLSPRPNAKDVSAAAKTYDFLAIDSNGAWVSHDWPQTIQIGGNETVGEGLLWWTRLAEKGAT